jgi:hypothetical protein
MNVTTRVSPEIAEAMTVAQLEAACQDIKSMIGPKADVYIGVSDHSIGRGHVSVHPDGICGKGEKYFHASTWTEAFTAARAWASTHKPVRRNNIIRKMALAIISITDEFGECAEARLRAADFSREDITEFHEAACARAGEMAMGSPFSVLMETTNV